MKSGFVNIFGKPNAGKSTLLNLLVGEKLAIVTPKVQTTRHRIKGIVTTAEYQIIFSDTPGIIEPKYKLHEKMMDAVKSAREDADVKLFVADVTDNPEEVEAVFATFKDKTPTIVVINKTDLAPEKVSDAISFFHDKGYKHVLPISCTMGAGIAELMKLIVSLLPEGTPFYDEENLTDLPMRFFVGEIIREKIFLLYEEEVPYHTTVLVQEFKEKSTLVKIRADIIVQRETQKAILLGRRGAMIKELGTQSRKEIEAFIGNKVFLELFVKVRPRWRDNDTHLREYGYN
ncbi:MAG: GTPase Era [Chitinophagaceae bacterium]|nr:GTPase Era [Chitinophagaceae bacterium]MCW5914143.1 GTPase Era [Chitinophagaceae bacterium]MCZ2395066.1 GTPase Era [Chitinophagales bacterium]